MPAQTNKVETVIRVLVPPRIPNWGPNSLYPQEMHNIMPTIFSCWCEGTRLCVSVVPRAADIPATNLHHGYLERGVTVKGRAVIVMCF